MAVAMAVFTLLPFVMLCIMGKTEQLILAQVTRVTSHEEQ
jgi:hypothetical protein